MFKDVKVGDTVWTAEGVEFQVERTSEDAFCTNGRFWWRKSDGKYQDDPALARVYPVKPTLTVPKRTVTAWAWVWKANAYRKEEAFGHSLGSQIYESEAAARTDLPDGDEYGQLVSFTFKV